MTKKWWESVTVWTNLLVFVGGVLRWAGVEFGLSENDVGELAGAIVALIAAANIIIRIVRTSMPVEL